MFERIYLKKKGKRRINIRWKEKVRDNDSNGEIEREEKEITKIGIAVLCRSRRCESKERQRERKERDRDIKSERRILKSEAKRS